MSGHSAGPWTVCEHSWSDTSVYAGDVRVCTSSIYDEATEDTQQDLQNRESANFRLIAAAPALLEALILARKELDGLPHSLGYDFTHIPKIDAAIAKATGAQP